jgi:dienelactone hydrolase
VEPTPPHLRPFVLPTRPSVPERAGSLDIYRPSGEGPWPAILFVHGGPAPPDPPPREWPAFRGYATEAAERSVAGGVVGHSLARGTALIEQAAAEVAAGADQLRAAPGIDPGRIALWFFSGSGLLAARWLERAPSWLRCVAATYPRFSLPDDLPDLPDLPTAIDAIARAPRLPVVLTRVGLERPDLAAAVEQFADAAASSGANLEIIDVPHGRHGFDFLDHTDESRAAVRQALNRVAAHLTAPLHGAGRDPRDLFGFPLLLMFRTYIGCTAPVPPSSTSGRIREEVTS